MAQAQPTETSNVQNYSHVHADLFDLHRQLLAQSRHLHPGVCRQWVLGLSVLQ